MGDVVEFVRVEGAVGEVNCAVGAHGEADDLVV